MKIRIDKVTKPPGWIKSGATYTLIYQDNTLYCIRTGKYIGFDRVLPSLAYRGIEGVLSNKLAGFVIDKMNKGRLQEVEEFEPKINDQNLDMMAREKDCYLIARSEIESVDFSDIFYTMKLRTKQGKFKFQFSKVTDREQAKILVTQLSS